MAIISQVENVPVHEGSYVYFGDWCTAVGYDVGIAKYEEDIKNEFYDWADEHGLTAQDL